MVDIHSGQPWETVTLTGECERACACRLRPIATLADSTVCCVAQRWGATGRCLPTCFPRPRKRHSRRCRTRSPCRFLPSLMLPLLLQEEGKTVIYHSLGIEWRPFGEYVASSYRVLTAALICRPTAEKETTAFRHPRWLVTSVIPLRSADSPGIDSLRRECGGADSGRFEGLCQQRSVVHRSRYARDC